VIGLDVTEAGFWQELDAVKTQVITFPFVNVEELNVLLFAPTLIPLTFHWYEGKNPPLIGVALNVIDDPEQIEVSEAVIETEGTTGVATVITIALEFTEFVV